MRKEVFIAIFIGFLLGLIITFGVHTARTSLDNRSTGQLPTPTPVSQENPTSHTITVNAPGPNAIIPQSTTEITGLTSPNALLSAVSNDTTHTTAADEQGNFNVTVDLEPGANKFLITSYNQQGDVANQEIDIVYSSADIDIEPTQAPTEDQQEDTDEDT